MSGEPDPKPEPRPRRPIRKIDRGATTRKLLYDRTCRACGRPASNGDHIIQKGSPHFGDDVDANIVPLCGTGTTGCHGARHGSPYTDDSGRYWTPEEVRLREGLSFRQDEIAYVLGKLGASSGREYLRREFGIEIVAAAGLYAARRA